MRKTASQLLIGDVVIESTGFITTEKKIKLVFWNNKGMFEIEYEGNYKREYDNGLTGKKYLVKG